MLALTLQRPSAVFAIPTRSVIAQNQRTKSVFNSPSSTRHNITRAQDDVSNNQSSSSIAEKSIDQIPTGCSRYSVSLGKPLGLILEERKSTGTIVVAEIVPGGNAEKSGVITVGDQLIATSGYTRTTEQMYGDITVKGGEQIVRLPVRGESFDTVLAAISSHPGNFQVKLEFQQCEETV
jgi:C-terminal processing protease CtpA/Prc